MKLPVHFYKPLAIGAPQPLRELPVRPERMIHFFPPHIEKIRSKAPETAKQCDVMCGNLEDAIPIESKDAARAGFIELLSNNDFGDTGMWVRINALNSPWVLDDLSEIIKHVGNKVDVIMVPKVEGPWDKMCIRDRPDPTSSPSRASRPINTANHKVVKRHSRVAAIAVLEPTPAKISNSPMMASVPPSPPGKKDSAPAKTLTA